MKKFIINFLFRDCIHCANYDIQPHLIVGYDTGYCMLYKKNVKNTDSCDCWRYKE